MDLGQIFGAVAGQPWMMGGQMGQVSTLLNPANPVQDTAHLLGYNGPGQANSAMSQGMNRYLPTQLAALGQMWGGQR